MMVVNIQTYGMLTTSQDKKINMKWSGDDDDDSDPDEIGDNSTYDSF